MIFYSARFRKPCSLSGGNTVGKPSSFTFSFFCSSVFSFRNLAPSTMTAVHPLLPHLKAISKEPPSCTLLTLDGGRVEVATHISPLAFVYSLALFWAFSYFAVVSSVPIHQPGVVPPPLSSQPLPRQPPRTSWTSSNYFHSLFRIAFKVLFVTPSTGPIHLNQLKS